MLGTWDHLYNRALGLRSCGFCGDETPVHGQKRSIADAQQGSLYTPREHQQEDHAREH